MYGYDVDAGDDDVNLNHPEGEDEPEAKVGGHRGQCC